LEIPRNPESKVDPTVLEMQRAELTAMLEAIMRISGPLTVEQVSDDRELQPLLTSTAEETMNAMSVLLTQFAMECLVELGENDETLSAILLKFGQKAADVGHRCGWIKGVADSLEQLRMAVLPDADVDEDTPDEPIAGAGEWDDDQQPLGCEPE